MILKKWTIDIPDYIKSIQLSKERRTKYYTIKEKIPKKYNNYKFKNVYLVDENGNKIVKNVKTAGTPKFWKINSQAIWSGNLHQFSRAKVSKELHSYFAEHITNSLIKNQKLTKIDVKENERLMFFFTFYGNEEINKSDLDNKAYIYVKTGIDTFTTPNSTNINQKDVIKLSLIEDDSLTFINCIGYNFIQSNFEKLEINIYLCTKDFNINNLLKISMTDTEIDIAAENILNILKKDLSFPITFNTVSEEGVIETNYTVKSIKVLENIKKIIKDEPYKEIS